MSWKFEQLQKGTATSVSYLAFDGRDVWAAGGGSNTYVYNYWDENTEYEYLDDAYYEDRNQNDLSLIATISTGAVFAMCKWYDHMYLMTGSTTIKKYNIATKTLAATLTIPEAAQGGAAMVAAYGKIWVVSLAVGATDEQKLYYYDIDAATWSSAITIPDRKQSVGRSLIDGLDGFLIVTNMNDHAIHKFNTSDGTYVSTVTVNRHPYALAVNQSKTVYVVTDHGDLPQEGMVLTFNQQTEAVAAYSAAGGELRFIFDDEPGGYLWFLGSTVKIGRLKKSNKDFRYVGGTAPGFTITFDDYSPAVPTSSIAAGLVTPPLTYEKWNGSSFDTVNVKPYVFFASNDVLYAARATAMVRVNSYSVRGTGMISTKEQDYIGDFT